MEYQWIDINKYSRCFNLSISTIRRRIKIKKLQVRKDRGKYLIKIPSGLLVEKTPKKGDNKILERKTQLLEQEIQELKMLIEIYEGGQLSRPQKRETMSPPELPLNN